MYFFVPYNMAISIYGAYIFVPLSLSLSQANDLQPTWPFIYSCLGLGAKIHDTYKMEEQAIRWG